MIETLEEIYKGSATLIKNKQYSTAKDYIEPFINKLSNYTTKFICYVKMADQLSIDGTTVNTVYNKVLVTGIFPAEYDFTTTYQEQNYVFHRVVCMAYSLEGKYPVCKFYTGVVDADMNFFAFGPDCVNIQKIEPETPIDYTPVNTVINNGLKDNCKDVINQSVGIVVPKSSLINTLGEWIDFTIKKEYVNDSGKIKLSNAVPVEVYKELVVNKDSDYYVEDDMVSVLTLLQVFASQVEKDDKDIINRYEKTQLINNLLKL